MELSRRRSRCFSRSRSRSRKLAYKLLGNGNRLQGAVSSFRRSRNCILARSPRFSHFSQFCHFSHPLLAFRLLFPTLRMRVCCGGGAALHTSTPIQVLVLGMEIFLGGLMASKHEEGRPGVGVPWVVAWGRWNLLHCSLRLMSDLVLQWLN